MGANPFHNYAMHITTLSPVHLGSGDDYEPTQYVIQNEALHAFHSEALLHRVPLAERQRLRTILEGKPNVEMIRQVQTFFYQNREALITAAYRRVRLTPTIEEFYLSRVGRMQQQQRGGQGVQNRLEIERTAYVAALNQPILPGSALKGAMRTALLEAAKGQRRNLPQLTPSNHSANNRNLQQYLFDYRDMHEDPLRLLCLSDARPALPESDQTRVYFAVNRKRAAVTDASGALRNSMAEQQGLYQLLESLPAPLFRGYVGELMLQEGGDLRQARGWPSWQPRVAELVAACNAFYLPLLARELAAMQRRSYLQPQWAATLERLLGGELGAALQRGSAFLLRVGRHSGAESVTLNGVRSIKIMQGKGNTPIDRSETTTWWLAAEERLMQRDLLPFGWLLVEVVGAEESLPALPELAAFGEYERKQIRAWRSELEQRYRPLIEKAQHQEAQAREEQARQEATAAAQRAKTQAEAEAKRRAEAEFQALPAFRRTLFDLQQELATLTHAAPIPLKKELYGELSGRLRRFIEHAKQWSASEQEEAATVLEAIYQRYGRAPSGLKADKRKKQEQKAEALIAALRNP